MSDIRLRWFMRRIMIPVLAWCMPRIPATTLREAFDRSYRHRDEEWRREVWRMATERSAVRT
jgi:hypothetical protein